MALLPCAALADSQPDILGAPVTLTVDLTGAVPSRCGFATAPELSTSLGDLGRDGSVPVSFRLDCNAMFVIRASAKRGALTHVGAVSPSANLAGSLNYVFTMNVDTDLGPVSRECSAATLFAGGCTLSSGDGVAIGTMGSLNMRWIAPARRIAAGSYQEAIEITVEVRT